MKTEFSAHHLIGSCSKVLSVELLILDEAGLEYACSLGLHELVARWFLSSERDASGLPLALSRWSSATEVGRRREVFRRSNQERRMVVWAEHVSNRRGLVFLFDERKRRDADLLPSELAVLLTPRQREIARMALQGWDNRLIASEVGLKESTVKKHMNAILTRLGVEGRNGLHVLARHKRVSTSRAFHC